MSIVSVSRWQIDPEQGQQVLRDAAPLLKQHGATRIAIARILSGQNTGQTNVIVTYENFESFGRAMEQERQDTKLQQLYQQAEKNGARLRSRNIAAVQDLD